MKMKIVVLCAVCVMAFSAMHFVEPAAAATPKGYLIDHGTKYWMDSGNGAPDKITWKTYWYSKNVRKVYEHYSYAGYGKWSKRNWHSLGTQIVTMYKVSKTKMKLKYQWSDMKKPYNISYIKTKMNTRNFYWKVYRPKIIAYSLFH